MDQISAESEQEMNQNVFKYNNETWSMIYEPKHDYPFGLFQCASGWFHSFKSRDAVRQYLENYDKVNYDIKLAHRIIQKSFRTDMAVLKENESHLSGNSMNMSAAEHKVILNHMSWRLYITPYRTILNHTNPYSEQTLDWGCAGEMSASEMVDSVINALKEIGAKPMEEA